MRIYFIYVTFGSLKEARNIGSKLVKNKLAACTNIIPTIYSTFIWKNKTKVEKECSMIIKTSKSKVKPAIDPDGPCGPCVVISTVVTSET